MYVRKCGSDIRLKMLTKLAVQATGNKVPVRRTALSDQQIATVMRDAYSSVFGKEPTAEVIAGGWAQICLENARGKSLYNNNFGNIIGKNERQEIHSVIAKISF